MNAFTQLLLVTVALLVFVVVLLRFALWLMCERCPVCGSRRTELLSESPPIWLCHRCLRYFESGPAGFYRDEK